MLVRLGRRVGGVSGGAIRPWLAPWLSAPNGADSVRLGGGDDIMQAPTRNSNLISHPNKDKLAKNKIKDATEDEVIRAANLNL